MKKLVVLGIGGFAVLTGAGSAVLVNPGVASSDPLSAGSSPYSVIGEPFGKALAVLRSQGIRARFNGAVGSDLPQAQCIVSQQRANSSGVMLLQLDCTKKAYDDAQASTPSSGGGAAGGVPGGPTVGSNGVTTVTPTPVGPQPGMSIPGA